MHKLEIKITLPNGEVWQDFVTITDIPTEQLLGSTLFAQAFKLLKLQVEDHLKEKYGGEKAA